MSRMTIVIGIVSFAIFATACQPTEESQPEKATSGMILSGDHNGKAFAMATGNEPEIFMEMVDAFNNRDAEMLWTHAADTITMHAADGMVRPMTQADMAGFFSAADSLSWEIDEVIPVQVEGTNRVKILSDGREIVYMKNGTVTKKKLFEEFTFEDEQLVSVRQWTAQMP